MKEIPLALQHERNYDEDFDSVEQSEEKAYPDLTQFDVDVNQLGLSVEDIEILREQIKEDDFRASADDYIDFLKTPVWEDLSTYLIRCISVQRAKLESLESTEREDLVSKARLHQLRMLLAYPSSVIRTLKLVEDKDEV